MRPTTLLFVLLVSKAALVLSTSYFVSQDNNDSDEDRFYIDDSNWPKEEELADSKIQVGRSLEAAKKLNYENVTVKVGRQALLPCFVDNLGASKVIWARNGDILALATTKINSDPRLNIQHRYLSEWHLVIDNVITDDEGEYICKTNGDFYKTINLQVLMPPAMDDSHSIPAGTINLKESSSLTLKCSAEGNPPPQITWYRWSHYKTHITSPKQQLITTTNTSTELQIDQISRDDPNTYECIATNNVPPATSRVFNIEIHFLPFVELKTIHSSRRRINLECLINANPLEKVLWFRNGKSLVNDDHYQFDKHFHYENLNFKSNDISGLDIGLYRSLVTLEVKVSSREDFGEYQCCAMNAYGQACSSVHTKALEPLVHVSSKSVAAEQVTSVAVTTPRIKSLLSSSQINDTVVTLDDKTMHYLMKSKHYLHLGSGGSDRLGLNWMLLLLLVLVLIAENRVLMVWRTG